MKWKAARAITGIFLIALSVLALIWWESSGREAFLMDSVMVARRNIERGTAVKRGDFEEIRNIAESTAAGAVTPENFKRIEGKVAKQFIPKSGQVTREMFADADAALKEGSSIFPIKQSWIDSRSSSLRKGDEISVFDSAGEVYLGTFQVAYVKDENEQEVFTPEGKRNEEILEREFNSSVISSVEIIAELEDYKKIAAYAEGGMTFLLMQKGEGTGE